MTLRLDLQPVPGGKPGEGISPPPQATTWHVREGSGLLSCSHVPRAGSPVTPPTGSVLVYPQARFGADFPVCRVPSPVRDRASNSTCPRWGGVGEWGSLLSLTHSIVRQMKGGARSAGPLSTSSTVLPGQAAGPTLPSAAAGEEQGQLNAPTFMTPGPAFPTCSR